MKYAFVRKILYVVIIITLAVALIPQKSFATGKLITDKITSAALKDNKLGDPNIRDMVIYLPPSYDSSDKRYPVIYLLHGFGGSARSYVDEVTDQVVVLLLDSLIEIKTIKEVIIVMPDGNNKYRGSYFHNSELTGNYEDYIAKELVSYIDAQYRTMRSRDACAIAGASMGGYGCITLAMKYSDVYSSVAALSPPLAFEIMINSVVPEVIKENPNGMTGPNSKKQYSDYIYALSAALSPNLDNPPFFVDLPFEYPSGKIIEPIKQKWLEGDPLSMVDKYSASLKAMNGIYIDVGTKDLLGFKDAADEFHNKLLSIGIKDDDKHKYDVFEGGHADDGIRRAMDAITFLSNLLPDTEPSSVKPTSKLAYTWGALKSQQ
jgi:S-formylglutathione hydrolase